MPKVWRIHPHDAARVSDLERVAGVSPIVAQLLICRGIDSTQARTFLDPKLTALREPELLPGLVGAVEVITAAIQDRQPIVVYGDYDADGMTATAIMHECLRHLGATVSYYVPHRIDEGYGLNDEAVRTLAARGTKLIITVDCGIASLEPARTARELGMQLVITDHHEFAAAGLPVADAIVHPRLPGTAYPFGGLSGAGVAFKLAWSLCQRASNAKKVSDHLREYLLQAVGIAAIGTVADVVPLVDENRVLVHFGLNSLRERPPLGIANLMKHCKLHEKPTLESDDIGFSLAPRLNAAGRLGQAQLGVELLITQNSERAASLAEYLHELNSSRDSLERKILLSANKQIQNDFDAHHDSALVLHGKGWHAGVIGIVAGRLAEKHHRPVVLIAFDEAGSKPGIGSVRSVPGFDVHAALAACSEHLVSHGGHAAAAGLKISFDTVDAFRESFCEHAREKIQAELRTAELWIDAETTLGALTFNAMQQLNRLAPFGHGNTRPLLCASHVTLQEPPKRIGGEGRHLSLKLVQHGVKIRGVAFGGGEWADALMAHNGPIKLAFRPVINHFAGRRNVEIQIADWQPQEAVVPAPHTAIRTEPVQLG